MPTENINESMPEDLRTCLTRLITSAWVVERKRAIMTGLYKDRETLDILVACNATFFRITKEVYAYDVIQGISRLAE